MEIIRAEQQAIVLSESLKLDIYRMPNGDLGIGIEEVKRVLGDKSARFIQFLQKRSNIPEPLRRAGFTQRTQVVVVQSVGNPKKVQIISLEDFQHLVFYESSIGNKRAIRLLALLSKSGLQTYGDDTVKAEKNTKRDLVEKRYEAAHQEVIKHMKIDELGDIETEEDILSIAISLTS